jgi:superfamily I DNA and/or RNA helicase/very-short-patch-repair endonuclease
MAPLVKYARAKRRPALRTMLGNAREAIQSLKPALFMSPLAAAQYLCHDDGNTYQFDAVIVDEASMIPTPDMVVALSLAPQAIIVGDSRQMPPTNFFNKEIAAFTPDDSGEEEIAFESILDEAAPLLPSTMLRAHYRSRDESLIAFSNVYFYDGRLIAFPDAWGDRPESGVRFELVADAVYGRGGTRANPAEALRAIEVLRAELQSSNFQKQVAITAMSLAQQQEIVEQLEQAAATDEAIRRWLDSGGLVRNLETVQGDESDIMILSVGYGKDADGRMILNFGPLGQEKGERRLNVAVTRARWKTVVVSSIRSGDIDPARTSSTGTLRLRDYLDYAERGPVALPATPGTAATDPRPFEHAVRSALETHGLDCVPQVGVGGYRVDIAVRHPQEAERFVLAVQCDGPTYFNAPACRDRDLGHTAVLKRMGWQVHRVHAPAWFRDPQAEIERILDRYRSAIA